MYEKMFYQYARIQILPHSQAAWKVLRAFHLHTSGLLFTSLCNNAILINSYLPWVLQKINARGTDCIIRNAGGHFFQKKGQRGGNDLADNCDVSFSTRSKLQVSCSLVEQTVFVCNHPKGPKISIAAAIKCLHKTPDYDNKITMTFISYVLC